MNLTGQSVLVTGAARGIGRDLTARLVDAGAHVVAVGRDRDRIEALAADHGDRVTAYGVDLADPAAVDALIATVVERHPTLSVVVNNAAVQTLTDFTSDDPARLRPVLRREITLNLDTVVALCTGLLATLRRQPSAAIVNITTGLALAPKRSAPVYCATKAGVRSFTRALRYQCVRDAPTVRVTEVVMTLVDTDMTRGRGSGKISPPHAADAVLAAIHRGRGEVYVGRTALLPVLMRLAPSLAYRTLRDG